MKQILDIIRQEMEQAFASCGYEEKYGMASVSNRPDLCQYQCNGAMAAAKAYKKAPLAIAEEVVACLHQSETGSRLFEKAETVPPGFINLNLKSTFLAEFLEQSRTAEKFGIEIPEQPEMIIVDYGGANVAKPLHVGHLRPAIIGESIKRISRYMGHRVIGDVHLGDWGLQMGQIITELYHRHPEWVYFDESYQGEYPKEAPFTIADLEEIYPTASKKSKEDESYRAEALEATFQFQSGRRGYRALCKHITAVSIPDLKKNYANLNVEFDLWKGESDVQEHIPDMVEKMKKDGFAHISEGALVVDVTEETDKKELPPCMILKSDGAALYETTDLATLLEREQLYHPNRVIYVVDKRQELHFTKVFRCAKKTGIVRPQTELTFLGNGTMNGKDGKPFKTREGGVMRLEYLIADVEEEVYRKMEGREMAEEECRKVARQVGLAALKYGDLSNQASKDYIFDLERFTSFEGNTGPYIQYTAVRIRSILKKYAELEGIEEKETQTLLPPAGESETDLMLILARFGSTMQAVFEEKAPHKLCQYLYEISNAFNHFYHENKILTEEDRARRGSWILLITLTADILATGLDLLGIETPDRM